MIDTKLFLTATIGLCLLLSAAYAYIISGGKTRGIRVIGIENERVARNTSANSRVKKSIPVDNYEIIWKKSLFSPLRQWSYERDKEYSEYPIPREYGSDPIPLLHGIVVFDGLSKAVISRSINDEPQILAANCNFGPWTLISIDRNSIDIIHRSGRKAKLKLEKPCSKQVKSEERFRSTSFKNHYGQQDSGRTIKRSLRL